MKPFDELTRIGQARRLRTLALEILKHFPIKLDALKLVQNDWNGIFKVRAKNGELYALRISRPGPGEHSLEEIHAERLWMTALDQESDISVPAPVQTRSGDYVVTEKVDGVPEARHALLFRWISGIDVDKKISGPVYFEMGKLSARLHLHAKQFELPKKYSVPKFTSLFPFSEDCVIGQPPYKKFFPPKRLEIYQEVIKRADALIKKLARQRSQIRLIHNDLQQWNVKIHKGELWPFDFEDLMIGHPLKDIATTFYHVQTRDDYPELCESFRTGYQSVLPWPETEPGQLDTLRAGRGVMLANLVVQSTDPEHKEFAPNFVKNVAKRLRAYLSK